MGSKLGTVFENETFNSKNGPCAVFDILPFSSGQRLVAFRGIITQALAEGHVIKVFREKTANDWHSSYRRCLHYIESKEIVQMYLRKNRRKMITFLDLFSAEMDQISLFSRRIRSSDKRHKRRLRDDDVVVFEKYLGKNFETFIERDGTVNTNCRGKLQEFVHFVYNESKGQEIVTGLKGVALNQGKKFKLTSPSMNSVGMKYGPDDIGERAILNFFATHECTNLCSQWPKPVIQNPFLVSVDPDIPSRLSDFMESLSSQIDAQQFYLSTPPYSSGVSTAVVHGGTCTDKRTQINDTPPPYQSQWRLDFEDCTTDYIPPEPSAPPLYDLTT
ncbi:alpha-protein kinase 1-like [Mizuhopecten yessoensis]|uniref:alpha-protein kinase 1-like n=1 Tax=Mizuhopecten yessoensis TaxID=6573 RepID=UPI000B4593D6|nr:alpha-protein kinase 1-like [Mizuhopecten yessoensis]